MQQYEFPCASATLRLLGLLRPSSQRRETLSEKMKFKSKKTTKREAKQKIRGP